jgi:hypothetical protein
VDNTALLDAAVAAYRVDADGWSRDCSLLKGSFVRGLGWYDYHPRSVT